MNTIISNVSCSTWLSLMNKRMTFHLQLQGEPALSMRYLTSVKKLAGHRSQEGCIKPQKDKYRNHNIQGNWAILEGQGDQDCWGLCGQTKVASEDELRDLSAGCFQAVWRRKGWGGKTITGKGMSKDWHRESWEGKTGQRERDEQRRIRC